MFEINSATNGWLSSTPPDQRRWCSSDAYDPTFSYLGLADAAIAMASQNNLLVLTDDLALHNALTQRGADALNFNHVRQLSWS